MRTERRLSAQPEQEHRPVAGLEASDGASAALRAPSARRLPIPRLRILAESEPLDQVRRRERNYRYALGIADMAAVAVSVPLVIEAIGDDRFRWQYLLLLPLVVLIAKILGLYDHDELVVRKSTIDELPRLINLASTFTLIVWGTRHWTVVGAPGTPEIAALWFSFAVTFSGGRAIARRVAALLSPVERCLVLGDALAYSRLQAPLSTDRGVTLVGCYSLARALRDETALRNLAAAERVHRIILAPDERVDPGDTLELVRRAKATGLRVSLLPGILEAVGSSVVWDDLGGVTLLGVPRFGLTRSSTAVKRGFDLLSTAVLLLVAVPVTAVAAVMIRLDSPGPVFFRQTRVGRDGIHFEMLKLRTMVEGADALKADLMPLNETHGLFKIDDDPRITRIGHWLRRTNIDELPQLINVLRGEMSLVGPRPLVVDEDDRVIGSDRRRLHLKPGMTGPWQTLGTRVALTEMVKVDYLYIANWSLWADVKILLRTIPHVIAARGR
ncbi:MAG: exopolysaccharide biosynthesis polyprenyl glycosylphosphotransferase [Solirubrobacteraceae bacterium]